MTHRSRIRPPFFEIGPKSYLVGESVLQLALAADRAAADNDVRVLFTSPLTEIARIASTTQHLLVLAPHMDPIRPGRGVADVLPESIVAAGAHGVLLNHAERPMTFAVLERTVDRAKEVGLLTVVCASSIAEIKAVAHLAPDVIVAEPTELIGSGVTSDMSYIHASAEAVAAVNADILVLQAAGITDGADVERVMGIPGADGTGSSSGIAKAADPGAMATEMIAAARRGWDARFSAPTTPILIPSIER